MSKHRPVHSFFISIRGCVCPISDDIVRAIDIDTGANEVPALAAPGIDWRVAHPGTRLRRSFEIPPGGSRQAIPLNHPSNAACALPSATGAGVNR